MAYAPNPHCPDSHTFLDRFLTQNRLPAARLVWTRAAVHAVGRQQIAQASPHSLLVGTLLGHFVTDSNGLARSTSEVAVDGNRHFRYGSEAH